MPNNTKTESSPTTNVKRLRAAANKWLIWKLAALCFWYWFLALRSHELSLPGLQYIGLVALAPVLRQFLRRSWPFRLFAIPGAVLYYFIGFPFLGVCWCVKLGGKVFTASQKTLGFLTSAVGFMLVLLFFIALLVAITTIKDPTALGILGLINVAAISALLLCGLAWLGKPLALFLSICEVSERAVDSRVDMIKKDPSVWKAAAQGWLPIAQLVRNFLYKYIVDETGRLRILDKLKRGIAPVIVAVVLVLFLILVSGYALTYYALQRSGVDMLSGLGNAPSLGLSWYFSLTISIAALHPGVIPNSSLGQLIQSLHLISSALFIVSALFLFSYAMSEHGKQDFRDLRDRPKRIMAKINGLIEDQQLPKALINGLIEDHQLPKASPGTDQEAIDIEGHEEIVSEPSAEIDEDT